MSSCPIQIKPFPVPKVWGGKHLTPWKKTDEQEPIGELVLISTIEPFPTYIENKKTKQTFQDYWEEEGYQKAIQYGAKSTNKNFPILLKILSTNEPLSLQVHPSTQDLKNKFNQEGIGKFESWVILDSDKEANVYFGLKDEYTIDALTETHDNFLDLFHQFHPKQGDVFRLEPGIIHGIQGSLLFFEIQQPSDYTFRIYDFGRNRQLHLEEAKKVIRKHDVPRSDWSTDLRSDYFSLDILEAHKLKQYEVTKPYEVFTYFGPPASIFGSFEPLEIKWGSTLFFWQRSTVSFEMTSPLSTKSSGSFEEGSAISSALPLINRNEARFFISSE